MNLRAEIELAIGFGVMDIRPLSGGCVGQVYRVWLADGESIVAKVEERPNSVLETEAFMLRYLATHTQLPVPAVLHSDKRLLLLEFVPGESRFNAAAQAHAAELLAGLHRLTKPHFGLERPTVIGGLPQPNAWADSWLPFFRQHRLWAMGQQGMKNGRLPAPLFARLERFCDQLDRWLLEPERPSLLHGDVWTTNVLASGNHVTGFLDPAIYYGHPEVELAFITLFGTFERPFFQRYEEIRPIPPGFWEDRRDIYNLYPLLVHVCLFGGSYVNGVDNTLRQFGF